MTLHAGFATLQSALLAHSAQLAVTGEQNGRVPPQSALLRQATHVSAAGSQCGASRLHCASLVHTATQVCCAGSHDWPVAQSAAFAHSPQRPIAVTHTLPLRPCEQSASDTHCTQPIPGAQPSGQRPTAAVQVPDAPPGPLFELPQPIAQAMSIVQNATRTDCV
jgi:hypothetical protein